MLRNYLKIAWRNLVRNKLYSLLNISGLMVGLAVSTFIALYVWHEFHFDQFHPFANRTYRILGIAKLGQQDITYTGFHESFGRSLKRQLPEVEATIRYSPGLGTVTLQSDPNHRFKEDKVGFADAPMLTKLGFRLRSGHVQTALAGPGQIVLTRPLAQKYFGQQDPIGRTILYDKQYPLTISAVVDDLPTNSIFQFNALVSLSSMTALGPKERNAHEQVGFLDTYVILRDHTDVTAFGKKMAQIKDGLSFTDQQSSTLLEALPRLHLNGRTTSTDTSKTLFILLSIAFTILALAITNYISLTTARATKRAREVGVRKAVGSQRSELISQFYSESFLTTTIAFMLSIGLLQVLFPWANQAFDLRMDSQVFRQPNYWGLMLLLWLFCIIASGIYPAFLLSGFRPHEVLKASINFGQQGLSVRRFFTTAQFTVSVGLLICSIVLWTQMRLFHTKNIGIDRSQIVAITVDADMSQQFNAFRQAVRQQMGPNQVAATNTALFTHNIMTYFLQTKDTKKFLPVRGLIVDQPFFRTLGIRWANAPVGWNQKPITRDLTVYNQTLLKETGVNGNPLLQPDPFNGGPIDGVITDFHLQSLHSTVPSTKLTVVSDTSRSIVASGGYLLVRLDPNTAVPQALAQLKAIYDRQQPTTPFEYYFLDDAYNRLYEKEDRLTRLMNSFTGLTLVVACLGLLGLITFNIETRTKEISVRKVLGASVVHIVRLLSTDFLKLVFIAVLIASPIASYVMHRWLEDFAYKISLTWWIFTLAGLIAVLVTLLTISVQSIKAARTNPVKNLRRE